MKYGKTYHSLLATATDKFQKNGYHATGIADVLQDSGATRGSMYHYFPDGKEDLAVAVLKNIQVITLERLETFFLKDRDPVVNFCVYFTSRADGIDNREENLLVNMLLIETAQISPRLRAASAEVITALDNVFFVEVARCGLLEAVTCQLASTILSMLLGAANNCSVLGDSRLLRNTIPQLLLLFQANGYQVPTGELERELKSVNANIRIEVE